jgi:predicted Zn-dependent protease
MNFDAAVTLIDDYSKKKGVKLEAYLFNSTVLKMESEDGSISNYVDAETSGLNVRLYDKKRMSFSYCLGLEKQKITDTVDKAASLLKFMDENDYSGFAEKEGNEQEPALAEQLGIYCLLYTF